MHSTNKSAQSTHTQHHNTPTHQTYTPRSTSIQQCKGQMHKVWFPPLSPLILTHTGGMAPLLHLAVGALRRGCMCTLICTSLSCLLSPVFAPSCFPLVPLTPLHFSTTPPVSSFNALIPHPVLFPPSHLLSIRHSAWTCLSPFSSNNSSCSSATLVDDDGR